jgi:hypothetical protein
MGRLLVVSACALVCAGTALAKTPQLVVSGAHAMGASAATTVELKGNANDAAWARVSVYVPNGYSLNLGQAAGSTIGTVKINAVLLVPNTIGVGVGTIVVADRSDPKLQPGAMQCAGPTTHAAIWLLHVMSGTTGDVPVYVDPTVGPEAAFSSAKLVLCLPNPYAEAAPGTRSPNGAKIFDAKLTLDADVLTSPPSAGRYVWRSLVTPWTVNSRAWNPVRTAETQGIAPVPSSLALHVAKKTEANSVVLRGTLLEDTAGVGGVRIRVFANGKSVGTVKTSTKGVFEMTLRLMKAVAFRATATVPTREAPCLRPLAVTFAPAGCASATLSGHKVRSGNVTVSARKP